MKELLSGECFSIKGGVFHVQVVATVPDELKDWTQQMIENIETGVIPNPHLFLRYLYQANANNINFAAITPVSISYIIV